MGFASFWPMVVHLVLITVGYADAAQTGVIAELWDLTWTTRGCCWPSPGTLALIMVVVTSVRAARERLRYESWHLLHLYAYLGVGLALPHQLWTGADFSQTRSTFAVWSSVALMVVSSRSGWARSGGRGQAVEAGGNRCRLSQMVTGVQMCTC